MQVFGTSNARSLAATRGATERSARAIRQLTGPRGRWIALALLTLSPFATPAAAQSGSEAVVCVGSERRTLATNPIRRVYTEDMEIVYRIGADIGQRDQVERDLSSELGSYPEVWCAWSDPGDDHAVIISYRGVIRQDLTVDPEDPRFQAFSVGFGTDFDAAETQATTINQRFSTYSDGSGFEVLLRETWRVASEIAAGVSAREPNLPDGPICTGNYSPDSCWMELADRPGCYLWNGAPKDGETVTWSGECSDGLAQGVGRTTWYQNHQTSQTVDTRLEGGRNDGWTVVRDFGDGAGEREGCYVDGRSRGRWTQRLTEHLSAGSSWDWTFFFSAGERIVANMESNAVDSYLRVLRDGESEVASDDDGGSGLNARLEFRVPVTGQYKIRTSAYDDEDSGPFVLWVGDRDPGTTNPGEDCGPR
ncbi:MAG: hypothetical protein F4X47_10460 [Gammaproteobacteria bacterium]|nr:hypothetical protein [Gammaproteobacteria bacterium]